MDRFSRAYLAGVEDADGFILKSRSPSCADPQRQAVPLRAEERRARQRPRAVHGAGARAVPVRRGRGRGPAQRPAPARPLPDEALGARVVPRRRARRRGRASSSSTARNKLLLMAHNQTRMRALGRLVADAGTAPRDRLVAEYRAGLGAALARPARAGQQRQRADARARARLGAAVRAASAATSWRRSTPTGRARSRWAPRRAIVGAWAARFEVPLPGRADLLRALSAGTRAARAPRRRRSAA